MKEHISLMRRHQELSNELQNLYRMFESNYGAMDLAVATEELNKKIWALQRDVFKKLSERTHLDIYTRS